MKFRVSSKVGSFKEVGVLGNRAEDGLDSAL